MKEKLLNPRIISETHDPEGREEILNSASSLESELLNIKEKIPLHEAKKIELAKKLSVLEKEAENTVSILADRLKTLIVRIKIRLGLNDEVVTNLEGKKQILDIEKESLLQELSQIEIEIENLKNKLNELPNPQELLDAYHEKMLDTPLTNEEKREFLKPEILASLSTEEYIQLWRRLNPHFLSHVTRQGIRDHNGMMYHTAGMNEFHNGFLGAMNGNREIKTPFAVGGLEFEDEEAINNFLQKNGIFRENRMDYEIEWAQEMLDKKGTTNIQEEMSLRSLEELLNHGTGSSYKFPDKTSVHFASQEVADSHYGAEKNNEIFFLYPADVIASQYSFSGKTSLVESNNNTMYNDVFVWPNSTKESGLPIDSGFVFLPSSTLVDPETGSKYATKIEKIDGVEKRVTIEDKELSKKFTEWLSSLNENSPLVVAMKNWLSERDWSKKSQKEEDFDQELQEELKKIGFSIDILSELTVFLIRNFLKTPGQNCQIDKETIDEIIKTYSGGKKRAENPITARKYWEKYFNEHPDVKPKHVVYYDGDPTTAVYNFLTKNKIGRADTSATSGDLLGFEHNFVKNIGEDPRANKGYTELYEIAKKIIDKHYN